MIDYTKLTDEDWADVGVPSDPEAHTRRAFVNAAAASFDADFDPPFGWVHIQRDDTLAWFDDDAQAAANISDDWRWYCPVTERMSPPCGVHDSTVGDGMFEAYPGPDDEAGNAPWTAELESWFTERDAHFKGDPPMGVRAIVPVGDAIEAGLLVPDETCERCAAHAGDGHHEACPHFFDERLADALTDAQSAFWEVIAQRFPEVRSGDFPPDAAALFERACSDAALTWLAFNSVPEAAE